MNPLRIALCLIAAGGFAACGLFQEPQARGGGLEGETLTLQGRAVYADGTPAAAAEIRLRSSDATDTALVSADVITTTDANGDYKIVGVQPGDYYIITEAKDAQGSFQELHVAPADSVPVIPVALPDTVKPKGAVRVRVLIGAGLVRLPPGLVQMPGLGKQYGIDSTGVLLIKDVPPGDYFIRVTYPYFGLIHRLTPLQGKVKAGDTLEVGPYTLSPFADEDLSTWKHSLTVTLNTKPTGADIAQNVIGFPVLLRLDTSNFPFSDVTERLDGSDLRFTDARGKRLAFEIENWDAPGSKAQIWVRLDTVYGNRDDQSFNILFGKADVFSPASPQAVYDTGDGVNAAWHFAMYNAGGLLSDATVNGNLLRMGTTRKESGVTGQAWIVQPGDELGAEPTASQEPASLSLAGWFKQKGSQSLGRLAWKHRRGEIEAAYSVTWLGGERIVEFALATAETGTVRAPVPTGKDWNHFAAVYDAKAKVASVYVNGKLAASLTNQGPIAYRTAGDLMLGSQPGGLNGFKGSLDEFRLYRTVWSPARAALEYQNSRPNANWVIFPPH